jgi:hypothetical protein
VWSWKHPRKIRFRQLVLLDHRPHRAIHDEDALAHEAGQEGGAIGLHGGSCLHVLIGNTLNFSIKLIARRTRIASAANTGA